MCGIVNADKLKRIESTNTIKLYKGQRSNFFYKSNYKVAFALARVLIITWVH